MGENLVLDSFFFKRVAIIIESVLLQDNGSINYMLIVFFLFFLREAMRNYHFHFLCSLENTEKKKEISELFSMHFLDAIYR